MLARSSLENLAINSLNAISNILIYFFIAQKLDPIHFSIFATFSIVSTLFNIFSTLGYEDVLLRNHLNWINTNRKFRSNVFAKAALQSRIAISTSLLLPVYIYINYLSVNKYGNQFIVELIILTVAALFVPILSCLSLLLYAAGNYVASARSTILVPMITRIFSLIILVNFDFINYIISFSIAPILGVSVTFRYLQNHYKINLSMHKFVIFRKLKYINFQLSSYANFFRNFFDTFIVSLLCRPEITASYLLAKKAEEIIKLFIDSLLDPKIQNTTNFKTNNVQLIAEINDALKISIHLLILITAIVLMAFNFLSQIINYFELLKYTYLYEFAIFSAFAGILYGFSKAKYSLIRLFDSSRNILNLDMYLTLTSVVVLYVAITFFDIRLLMSARVVMFVLFYYLINYNYQKKIKYKL